MNTKLKRITEDGINFLKRLEWKGNVRELKHLMEKVAIMIEKEEIDKEDIVKIRYAWYPQGNTL